PFRPGARRSPPTAVKSSRCRISDPIAGTDPLSKTHNWRPGTIASPAVAGEVLGGDMERRLARLGPLGLALLLVGCGGGDVRYPQTGATLEGTVSYGKEKVGAALVIAQNSSGSATTFVDETGHHKLDNVPLGEINLAVNTEAGKGQAYGR